MAKKPYRRAADTFCRRRKEDGRPRMDQLQHIIASVGHCSQTQFREITKRESQQLGIAMEKRITTTKRARYENSATQEV